MSERIVMTVAVVATAMAAGAFFPFSTFAIRGLKKLPATEGARAMQKLNEEAPSLLFMVLIFGTGLLCVGVALHAVRETTGLDLWLRLAGAAIYVVGVVAMTIAYHVPRNDRLAAVDAASPEGISYWEVYLSEWVSMNHVRTAAPLLTSILFLISMTD